MIGKQSSHVMGISGFSFIALIGLIAFSSFSPAQDQENEDAERFEFAAIAIEASVVRVEVDVLREVMGDGGNRSLMSVPLDKIWLCIREEAGEVVSGHQLLIGNGRSGEMITDNREQGKHKDQGAVEQVQHEMHVSFEARAEIVNLDRIALEVNFKQITVEEGTAGEAETEEEHAREDTMELSSSLVLPTGRPRILSAKSNGHMATFLIVTVDI